MQTALRVVGIHGTDKVLIGEALAVLRGLALPTAATLQRELGLLVRLSRVVNRNVLSKESIGTTYIEIIARSFNILDEQMKKGKKHHSIKKTNSKHATQ